ncbi:hypothetical protein ACIRCZ_18700 [Leifsonia sp. NPDC102414]|uniref:hypothetical protein n=1 Tax=Leifsonia sp. NPDC102414 TaxID=3364124 RepID=UPI003815B8F9
MNVHPTDDADEFLIREYARRLSVDPRVFFQNKEDLEGIRELVSRRLAPQTRAYAASKGIPFVGVNDVGKVDDDAIVHILTLLSRQALAEAVSEATTSPFGVAYTDIVRSLNKQTDRTYQECYVDGNGKRHKRTLWVDHVDIDTPGLSIPSPSATYDLEMTLTEAIDRAATLLEELSPDRVVDHVFPAVNWLTMNWPPRRSYEHLTLSAATDAFPQLHGLEVKAIAAATWGARNRSTETSLIAAYLRIPGFSPATSSEHRRVLHRYRCELFQPGLATTAPTPQKRQLMPA